MSTTTAFRESLYHSLRFSLIAFLAEQGVSAEQAERISCDYAPFLADTACEGLRVAVMNARHHDRQDRGGAWPIVLIDSTKRGA